MSLFTFSIVVILGMLASVAFVRWYEKHYPDD